MHAAEIGLDLRLGEMHRRRDDVRRQFMAKLDDVFAKIGFDRRDAVGFEEFVDGDFLADHRLAFGDGFRAELAAEIEHDLARILRRHGVVDLAALRDDALFPGFEIEVEVGKRVVLDIARTIAQRLELGQLVGDFLAPGDEIDLDEFQRALQVGVGERVARIFLEAWRCRERAHAAGSCSSADRPIAGSTSCPRELPQRDARRSPCLRAAACRPCSSDSRGRPRAACRAPVAAMFAAFFSTMALEISGYFTQNVPPKPQHTSESRISTRRTPCTVPSKPAGLRVHAEFAQARTGVVIGNRAAEMRLDVLDLQHVDEKGHQLKRLRGECVGTRAPVRVAGEQFRIMRLQHAGAGARRRNDIVERAKIARSSVRRWRARYCGRRN